MICAYRYVMDSLFLCFGQLHRLLPFAEPLLCVSSNTIVVLESPE